MSGLDYLVNSLMAIVLIVGSYQFYFFVQRRYIRAATQLHSRIDESIPFSPGWVWIYSGLYYPVIVLGVLTIDSFAKFNYTVFSFIILLAIHLLMFFAFPVETPAEWRNFKIEQSLSTRLLGLVQKYDAPSNTFPSLHVSVSMLTALHLHNNLVPLLGQYAALVYLFPALISISSIYTKQHYLVDVPTGAIIAYFNYKLFEQYWYFA